MSDDLINRDALRDALDEAQNAIDQAAVRHDHGDAPYDADLLALFAAARWMHDTLTALLTEQPRATEPGS